MKTTIMFLLLTLSTCFALWADDVDVNLSTDTSPNGFSVKDSSGSTKLKVRADGNVGVGTTAPNHKLDVNGNIGVSAGGYYNVGSTDGTSGYGFRDNSGVMEYKNSGGAWTGLGYIDNDVTSPYGFSSGTYSYAQIAYNHGNYGNTMPSVEIGADAAYETMLPVTLGSGGGTPWETIESGDVSVVNLSSKPAYLKINAAGLYRISASVAIKGTSNTSIEVEVFRQNSGSIPATNSWVTLTHDLEALSTAISVTTNQYDAGSVNGVYQLAANDYLALCSRVVSGSTSTQKVICINFNVERIK